MKRVIIGRFGGPEVVEVVEDADPRPGSGEVRVRVLASGVSFTDALIRAGTYLGGPKPPFTPGYELRSRSSEPTGRSTGIAAHASTHQASSARSLMPTT